MVFAELIDVLEAYAPVLGIAIAIVLFVAVPPLRRSLVRAFQAGKEQGEKARQQRKKKP